MQPDIERLADLQAVDLRVNDLRAKLAAFPQQLAEIEKHAIDSRQQLAAAKEALTNSAKDRKRFELDVESWKEKARKYRDQSSAVKTNEAYKALQHEITHAEKEAAQAEDRLLERMMGGEEVERQVKAAEVALKETERETETKLKEIKAKQSTLQKELEAKQAERQEKIASVPEELFQRYERIGLRRHGIGMAEVIGEACSQCGVRIIPHIFQELRRADCHDIFQCETCTRILYYIEPPAAPADANSSAASAPANNS
jgi:predicted  nucleic acid-binding Zn-ribbon protein